MKIVLIAANHLDHLQNAGRPILEGDVICVLPSSLSGAPSLNMRIRWQQPSTSKGVGFVHEGTVVGVLVDFVREQIEVRVDIDTFR